MYTRAGQYNEAFLLKHRKTTTYTHEANHPSYIRYFEELNRATKERTVQPTSIKLGGNVEGPEARRSGRTAFCVLYYS
jgi:hypothetical protein